MKKFRFLMSLSALIFLATACGKKSSSGGGTVVTNTYYLVNSVCYDSSTHERTNDSSKCSDVQYNLVNNVCYDLDTNRPTDIKNCTVVDADDRYEIRSGYCYDNQQDIYVPISFCGSGSGGYPSEVCHSGLYSFVYNGAPAYIDCGYQNCSGYQLTNVSTNQQVICR